MRYPQTVTPAKRCAAIAGTHRALLADMHDAIEAINFEQLATITDRLLLRRVRVSKHRPSVPSLVPLARGSQPQLEQTAVVRSAAASHAQVFAITVVIPMFVGIAVGLAALL